MAAGVGWSKTSVADSRSPVAALSRLRSSTPVSESNPRSLNAWSGSTASADRWPSTAATVPRTRSSTSSPRSSAGSPASRPGRSANAGSTARAGTRTSDRNSGARTPAAAADRSAGRSSAAATAVTGSSRNARSNRSRPSSSVIARAPPLARRDSSTAPSPAVRPDVRAHRPHASDVPGRPAARRCAASPSRNALAAAYPP